MRLRRSATSYARSLGRLSEVAYEAEVKRGYDIRTGIEEEEERVRILRLDLEASMAALVPPS